MKPNLLLLSSNLLKSTVCSAPFAPSAIALTAVPRRRAPLRLGFASAGGIAHFFCLGSAEAFFCRGKGFAHFLLCKKWAKPLPRQKKAEAKGAEQKEFYASPLAKKVQNKENHPDKAEKEIGEIL